MQYRQLAHELVWCQTVNSRGGAGSNISAYLYLEHLNRTLKEYLNGVGPNISSNAIVQTSKSLKCLLDVTTNYDRVCNIGLTSIHHTSASLKEDRHKIITQLTESRVFDYIPGCFHNTFNGIKPHVLSHIDVEKLTQWIQATKESDAKHFNLKQVLQCQ